MRTARFPVSGTAANRATNHPTITTAAVVVLSCVLVSAQATAETPKSIAPVTQESLQQPAAAAAAVVAIGRPAVALALLETGQIFALWTSSSSHVAPALGPNDTAAAIDLSPWIIEDKTPIPAFQDPQRS